MARRAPRDHKGLSSIDAGFDGYEYVRTRTIGSRPGCAKIMLDGKPVALDAAAMAALQDDPNADWLMGLPAERCQP